MERLPDNAMVNVIQYLDLTDLFTCRLVCKRIGAVAVHPDVWRDRPGGRREWWKECVCPVLRVAPCSDSLNINISDYCGENKTFCSQLLLALTRCAARTVAVSVNVSERGAVALASLFIRRQEELGRLRAVQIELDEEDENGDDASVLLATVASMPDLKRLVVAGITASKPSLVSLYFTSASLEYFECELRPESASFCALVIAANANALKEVVLVGKSDSCSKLTSLAPLLAGLPNLRRLRCRMLPGLGVVADSASLRELTLDVRPEDQPSASGAAALLSGANQLRAVTLDYTLAPCDLDLGVSLVLALGASGQSAVESLTFLNSELNDELPQAQPLLAALPYLPALRHLQVGVLTEALLLGISPASAPALQTLSVRRPSLDFEWHRYNDRISDSLDTVTCCKHHACVHSWLHIDAVNTLLSVNPSLQLLIPTYSYYYCGLLNSCVACRQGCHPKLRDCKDDQNLKLTQNMLVPRNIPL
ncbi:uncharacterized protein LOC113205797 isoform X1 [Frankliniella occidentalis]|uniref:Uncharacterized protein LOC113205797 isoform X1 n=1 Tax=Frankliniella occidentalis TaxID=133901 RepID=A0A9C6UBA0_FRAOC|nr:uncharacterized protein LOC113205797 isoform X1 [Frankliniella occidentalis]XP_052123509.1 uncharacterized protein LOC113205797 isoform X1 [Frankliniella occidentalis]